MIEGAIKRVLFYTALLSDTIMVEAMVHRFYKHYVVRYIFFLFCRRNFGALRKGRYKLVVGMDDTYDDKWHPRYKGKDLDSMEQPSVLPGAIIDCGVKKDNNTMCNSKNGSACLFDMEHGKLHTASCPCYPFFIYKSQPFTMLAMQYLYIHPSNYRIRSIHPSN